VNRIALILFQGSPEPQLKISYDAVSRRFRFHCFVDEGVEKNGGQSYEKDADVFGDGVGLYD
jgi:hypothetical protein